MRFERVHGDGPPLLATPAEPDPAAARRALEAYLGGRGGALRDHLDRHGAVLLRGFGLEGAADLEWAARLAAPRLADNRGGDAPRDAVGDGVFTSTRLPSEHPIPPHNEMSYTSRYPELLLFLCEVAPESGGETPLVDGRALYAALDPAVARRFAERGVRYVRNLSSGHGLGKSWQETFGTDDAGVLERLVRASGAELSWNEDGSVRVEEVVPAVRRHPRTGEEVFFCQADQWHWSQLDRETLEILRSLTSEDRFYHACYYGDGGEIDPSDLDAVRDAVARSAVPVQWRRGDLLVVDNVLTLHGRRPYTGERRVLVAMGDSPERATSVDPAARPR